MEKYEISKDILVAHDVSRTKDGFFKFEHEWMDGEEADLDTDQDVFVDADALWTCDLRHREFKDSEQKIEVMPWSLEGHHCVECRYGSNLTCICRYQDHGS